MNTIRDQDELRDAIKRELIENATFAVLGVRFSERDLVVILGHLLRQNRHQPGSSEHECYREYIRKYMQGRELVLPGKTSGWSW